MNNVILTDVTLPVGSVIAFVGKIETLETQTSPPGKHTTQPIEAYGWMLCDGSALDAAKYPELYAALGTLYGPSGEENSGTFHLPDLSGKFLRGIGTDPASTEDRTAAKGGDPNGVGSTQSDAFLTHTHPYNEAKGTAVAQQGEPAFGISQPSKTGPPDAPKQQVSALETRPVNVFVNYLIKYTYKLPTFDKPALRIR